MPLSCSCRLLRGVGWRSQEAGASLQTHVPQHVALWHGLPVQRHIRPPQPETRNMREDIGQTEGKKGFLHQKSRIWFSQCGKILLKLNIIQVWKFRTSYTLKWLNVLICVSFQALLSVVIYLTVTLMFAGEHQGQAAQHSYRGVFGNIGHQKTQVKERPPTAPANTRCFSAEQRCCHGNHWDRNLQCTVVSRKKEKNKRCLCRSTLWRRAVEAITSVTVTWRWSTSYTTSRATRMCTPHYPCEC